MKLYEKLEKLRKQNAWSQEEFAEKLGVTRQTISKWELGQTTPDTEKLTKIASIFGTTVNDLLDENAETYAGTSTGTIPYSNQNNYNQHPNPKKQNTGTLKIVILVIVLIAVIGWIGLIIANKNLNKIVDQEAPKSITQMFKDYKVTDILGMIFGQFANIEKEAFNSKFNNLYFGTEEGIFMDTFIDEVIKSNQKNTNRQITVKFKDFESNNAEELRGLKKQLKTGVFDKYEIYYEYDEKGFINKAIIEEDENETENDMNIKNDATSIMNQFGDIMNSFQSQQNSNQKSKEFNNKFKTLYYGSTNGFFMKNFLDEVVKSNEENPEHIIKVELNGNETSDASELRNMKDQFSNNTNYEITYEYDENGFINKAKIK